MNTRLSATKARKLTLGSIARHKRAINRTFNRRIAKTKEWRNLERKILGAALEHDQFIGVAVVSASARQRLKLAGLQTEDTRRSDIEPYLAPNIPGGADLSTGQLGRDLGELNRWIRGHVEHVGPLAHKKFDSPETVELIFDWATEVFGDFFRDKYCCEWNWERELRCLLLKIREPLVKKYGYCPSDSLLGSYCLNDIPKGIDKFVIISWEERPDKLMETHSQGELVHYDVLDWISGDSGEKCFSAIEKLIAWATSKRKRSIQIEIVQSAEDKNLWTLTPAGIGTPHPSVLATLLRHLGYVIKEDQGSTRCQIRVNW